MDAYGANSRIRCGCFHPFEKENEPTKVWRCTRDKLTTLRLIVVLRNPTHHEHRIMGSFVEHANIAVTDVDAAISFFSTAMPDFWVRHDSGRGANRWVHFGTDVTYISINQIPDPVEGQFEGDCPGYQHIGFVVEDVDALRARMLSAGYREGFHPKPHPHHKRVYFIDNDGMEYEFVQYYSDDFTKRNDYDL